MAITIIGTPTDFDSARLSASPFNIAVTPPAGVNRACFMFLQVDNPGVLNPGYNVPTYNGVAMTTVAGPVAAINGDRLAVAFAIAVANSDTGSINIACTKAGGTADSWIGKVIYCDNVNPASLTNTAVTASGVDVTTTLTLTITNPDTTNGMVLFFNGGFDDAQTYSNTGEGTLIGSAITENAPAGTDHNMAFRAYYSTGDASVAAVWTPNGSYSRMRSMGFSLNYTAPTTTVAGKARATQGRAKGVLTVKRSLDGKARSTQSRSIASRFSFVNYADPARATQPRAKGVLGSKQSLASKARVTMARALAVMTIVVATTAVAGKARATQDRARGVLTPKSSLVGYARATQARGRGTSLTVAISAPCVGTARATQARATGSPASFIRSTLAGKSRATQGRGKGALLSKVAASGKSRATQSRSQLGNTITISGFYATECRATQARAFGNISGKVVLAGKARATQARAKGFNIAVTPVAVAGKARATQARANAPKISFTNWSAPARATQARASGTINATVSISIAINRAIATQARTVADIDINIYNVYAAIATQARGRGALTSGTSAPIAVLVGKARATQARVVSDIDINIYAVSETRATQARMKGALVPRSPVPTIAMAGKARATMARARIANTIIITVRSIEARATQARAKSYFIINRTPLVGKSRATQARSKATGIIMVYRSLEARATQARTRSDITLEIVVQPSPATQARARASASYHNITKVTLAGKARATQARARASTTIYLNTQAGFGIGRATQARAKGDLNLCYYEGPSRASQARVLQTSTLNARTMAGSARATQARTLSEATLGVRIYAIRATQARTISEASTKIPQGPSRGTGARVFGRALAMPPTGSCYPAVYNCTVVLSGTITLLGPADVPAMVEISAGNQIVPGFGCITTGIVDDGTVVVPPEPPEPEPVVVASTSITTQARGYGTLTTLAVPPQPLASMSRMTQARARGSMTAVIVAYTTFQAPTSDSASLIGTSLTVAPFPTTWQLITAVGNTNGFVRLDGAVTSGVMTSRRLLYTDYEWPNENFEIYADWVRPSSSEVAEDNYMFACASADYAHFYQIAWRPVWLSSAANVWFVSDQGLQFDVTGFNVPTGTAYPRLGFTVGPGASNYISIWTEPNGGGARTVHLTLTPDADHRGSIYRYAGFGATTVTPLAVKCTLWGFKSPGG